LRIYTPLTQHCIFQEKIAQELLEHEQTLYGSKHGKFIIRNCRIDMFKRRREQWRQHQQGLAKRRDILKDIIEPTNGILSNATTTKATSATTSESTKGSKRKRTSQPTDEIDALFASISKKVNNMISHP
jgi:hypothetical protein